MSRAVLAAELGVTPVTLYRWETGSTRPSPVVAEKLGHLGFGSVIQNETNVASVPRLKSRARGATIESREFALRDSGRIVLNAADGQLNILPAPFVRNGPPDQVAFHRKLLDLQVSSKRLSGSVLSRRLSMVEDVDGKGAPAQHSLERSRPFAVSWNSNYGTHGWHRYVGRFPPHVVRSLLNHFGANEKSVVCDPFAGSGTTAVECRLLGIPFVGIEICPLSCLMTRTKAAFPTEPTLLADVARNFTTFYNEKWGRFLKGRQASDISHKEVLARKGNPVPEFKNVERWFTPEALLGVSIAVEIGMSFDGFARDATLLALSSKMRSIGNVDVDVVRAEYSKRPRENVEAGPLITRQLHKMAADVTASLSSHAHHIGPARGVVLHEASVLDVDLNDESIDYVITSPPYGIEAISYLRTHLLSYRSLFSFFGHDPYDTRDKTIGSEYIADASSVSTHGAVNASSICRQFFSKPVEKSDSKLEARRAAMIKFFDDMLAVGERMSKWLKDGGQVAFIVGNKRLGDDVIPMDTIITELFAKCGLEFLQGIQHKLKTNNSNSQVPWQERIIQEESILLFKRAPRT
jgi:site-specific DNA-methyltransferase (cytosine-N4-specific)